MNNTTILFIAGIAMGSSAHAQQPAADTRKNLNELRLNLSADGERYIKATFLNQTWVRWNQSNEGTTVNGESRDHTVDIGLRRTRMQLYGQLNDHTFFYTQFGMNNFNYLSQNAGNRKLQPFFHDVLGEYKVFKTNNMLKIGGGLTIINGLSRFSQPSIGTILTTDVPVFLQTTVDQTDEFARKLAIYARGQVAKLDYRVAVADPFPIQTNGQAVPAISSTPTFTPRGHSYQYSALFIYNILDQEPHTTPYMAGTYLGEKKILNIEAGAIYQPKATWNIRSSDTVYNAMLHYGAALFADMPLVGNQYAFTAYAGYFLTDYGPGYIRNNGIMNPANGNSNATIYNGAGNAYPMFGTGNNTYAQAGVRLPNQLLGNAGTLLPYVAFRSSKFAQLANRVNVYEAGINWLMNKHQSKLSLNYELRPVFAYKPLGEINRIGNASGAWIQYQVFF